MSRKPIITVFFALLATLFCGCSKQMTLEEKAAMDAEEYNRRYCPTPEVHFIRTDSINFDAQQHLFTYNCSFCGKLDNPIVVELNKQMILNLLTSSVKESTSMKTYVESGYHFKYICHSDSTPEMILFEAAF